MTKEKKPRRKSVITSALYGRWLPTSFFGRHWGIILAIVVLTMIYITNRYQCITAMETIQKLEKELQVMQSERIREKSAYMSNIRESAMQHRIDSIGLGLQARQQPPFLITY